MTWPAPQFGKNDWQVHSSTKLASGFFELDRLTISHSGYRLETLGPMSRELFVRDPAVVVMLVDRKLSAVVLVEQFRIGAAIAAKNDSPWLIEWVAGICNPGECPVETCKREVFEETGIHLIDSPKLLFSYYPSPGGSNELIHLFVGYCDASDVSTFGGQVGEFEDLKVHVVPIESAIAALHAGQIDNAATIIGIQWLEAQAFSKR